MSTSSGSGSLKRGSELISGRLGKCLICKDADAKYTCPACDMVTCSLPCVKKHKKDLKCDGIRLKTSYVQVKNMDELHLLSDYRLLEDLGRCAEACKRDKTRNINRNITPLSMHLQKLKKAVSDRGSRVYFLPKNFMKHKENTTYYDWKAQKISWRLRVTFLHAKSYSIVVDRCSEEVSLESIIDKCLKAAEDRKKEFKKHFEAYKHRSAEIHVLLKAEKTPGAANKFHLLENQKSLKDNLVGKRIVEYPHVYVTVAGFYSSSVDLKTSKAKSKMSSLLLSSYSIQGKESVSEPESESDVADSKDEENSESEESDDDTLLQKDGYNEILNSLYKIGTENP